MSEAERTGGLERSTSDASKTTSDFPPPASSSPTPMMGTPVASSTAIRPGPSSATSLSPPMDHQSTTTDLNLSVERSLDSAQWLNAGTPEVFYRRSRVQPFNRAPDNDFFIDDSEGEDDDMLSVSSEKTFLNCLLDSPQEPDPEEYEPIPPCMIPLEDLDVDSSMLDEGIVELLDSSQMDTNTTSNPPTPTANVQMLLPSLFGAFEVRSVKELIKQPAFKGQSGSLQQSQNQNQGRSPTVKRGLLGDRPSHPGRGPHMMDRLSGRGWGGQRQVPERPVHERRPSLMGPYPPRGTRPWSGTDGRQQRRTHTNMKGVWRRVSIC